MIREREREIASDVDTYDFPAPLTPITTMILGVFELIDQIDGEKKFRCVGMESIEGRKHPADAIAASASALT